MNLLLLTPEQQHEGNRWQLTPRQAAHVLGVLNAVVGQQVRAGILNGEVGYATIESIENNNVEVFFKAGSHPANPPGLSLLLALPRPKMLKRILIDATSLGIKQIVLINSWKVDKSYWQTPNLKNELLHEKMLLGLEQARDTVLPEVSLHRKFKPFAEDILPQFAAGSRRLLCHPGATTPCPASPDDPLTVAIGPDGGWTEYEVGRFEESIGAGSLFGCFEETGERATRDVGTKATRTEAVGSLVEGCFA